MKASHGIRSQIVDWPVIRIQLLNDAREIYNVIAADNPIDFSFFVLYSNSNKAFIVVYHRSQL